MRAGEKGFTLLEVLVALTVMAIVISTVYGIFSRLSAVQQGLDKQADEYHLARVLLDRIAREVRSSFYLGGDSGTVFRGGSNGEQYSFLELTTSNHSPVLQTAFAIVKVSYRHQESSDGTETEHFLVRREQVLLPGSSFEPIESRLGPQIYIFKLSFFDGTTWLENWDADQRRILPQMIKVYLELGNEAEKIPFSTTVSIPRVEI